MEAHLAPIGREHWAGGLRTIGRLSDEKLARLAADGDEQAFSILYERYHQQLYRYCRSILPDEADAKDALQSTFASAFAALGRWRRDAPLRPWLFRIAHNESINVIRRRRLEAEMSEVPDQLAPSVEAQAADRERLSMLVSDLRDLPERQRSALLLRELNGLSHEEIAVSLGLTVGAAKQTIFEARRSLSDRVEGRDMSCLEIRRTISDSDGRRMRGRKVKAHLSDCSGCAAFATSIPTREASLRALVPPLPAAAAAGILSSALGKAGAAHGGGAGAGAGAGGVTAGGAGGIAASAVGNAMTVFIPKAIIGLVVAGAATAGVTTAVQHVFASSAHTGLATRSSHGHTGHSRSADAVSGGHATVSGPSAADNGPLAGVFAPGSHQTGSASTGASASSGGSSSAISSSSQTSTLIGQPVSPGQTTGGTGGTGNHGNGGGQGNGGNHGNGGGQGRGGGQGNGGGQGRGGGNGGGQGSGGGQGRGGGQGTGGGKGTGGGQGIGGGTGGGKGTGGGQGTGGGKGTGGGQGIGGGTGGGKGTGGGQGTGGPH